MLKEILEKMSNDEYSGLIDKIADIIARNSKADEFFNDWIFSDGPGKDERYKPDKVSDDYLFDGDLSEKELLSLISVFKKKSWK